jgi:hypothetical protein
MAIDITVNLCGGLSNQKMETYHVCLGKVFIFICCFGKYMFDFRLKYLLTAFLGFCSCGFISFVVGALGQVLGLRR